MEVGQMNIGRLKEGWVIEMDFDFLIEKYGTLLWKIIRVSDFSASIVPLKSIAYYEYDSKQEMENFYNTIDQRHISPNSQVRVMFRHFTNLEIG